MKTIKLYKTDVKGHVKDNWKTLLHNWKAWAYFLVSAGISAFIYSIYDWTDSTVRSIAITEGIAVLINLIIIGSFYKLNTFMSYLYFLFAFKFVHICVALAGYDIYKFGEVHKVEKISENIVILVSLTAIMMLVGFTFANALITPLVAILFLFNLIESRILVKLKTKKSKISFYILWTATWVFILMFILSKIQYIEEDALYNVFISMLHQAGVNSGALSIFASALYFLMSKGLFIIWFTILLKVNSYRGTDMFLRNAWSLGMASSILFIGYQIEFLDRHMESGDIIALPIFMMIVTLLFLFRSIFYFSRTVRWNWKKLNSDSDKYIPYVFDKNKKLNLIVQAYYYHQDKKSITKEIKIKK